MIDFFFVVKNWKKLIEFLRDVAHGPTAGYPLREYEKFIRNEAMGIIHGK